MPNYKFVSAKEIMARVIRALGYKLPSTYQDDILEWIGEGIGFIQVTNSLVVTSSGAPDEENEIIIRNHCAALPCGFVNILAVEDENGNRLPQGGDVTDIRKQTSSRHSDANTDRLARISTFEVNPYDHQTSDGLPTTKPGTSVPLYGEDIIPVNNSDRRKAQYYNLQGNHIQTSFECGFIRLHYLALPVDKEGYPLIPDNENFKQALEWHLIRRLVGSGYEHKVFNYEYSDQQFEKFAARAMNELSYYSLDGAAKANRSFARLIPPYQFSDDFFIGSEQPEILFK